MVSVLPRVMVGVTTYEGKDYIFHKCMKHIKELDYPQHLIDVFVVDNSASPNYFYKLRRRGYSNLYRVGRGDNSREALTNSQNKLRALCLEGGYDYLFFVESDLLISPDSLKRLLSYGKPVVGSTYNIGRGEEFIPCIFLDVVTPEGFLGTRALGIVQEGGKMSYYPAEIDSFFAGKEPIKRVHGCGLGCTLVSKDIVSRFPFWCDSRFDNKHSDVYFYLDLKNSGIPVYVDVTVVVPHFPSDWGAVKDR
jgi:hypothetical protein